MTGAQNPAASASAEQTAGNETVNVQVVSPSIGINGPISFPEMPLSTTVKELKGRIREAVATNPSDDHQRLIHQGRLLSRETETLREIFGRDAAFDTRTLHLVLRPAQAAPPVAPTPTTRTNEASEATRPVPGVNGLPGQPHESSQIPPRAQAFPPVHSFNAMPLHAQFEMLQQQRNHQVQALQEQARRIQLLQQQIARQPLPGEFAVPPLQQQPGLYPPVPQRQVVPGIPPIPNILGQHLRDHRAAMGMPGRDHLRGSSQARAHSQPPPTARRTERSSMYTRESVGPNGERIQITTINEPVMRSSEPLSHTPHHPADETMAQDASAVLRNGDTAQAMAARHHTPSPLHGTTSQASTSTNTDPRRGESAPTTPLVINPSQPFQHPSIPFQILPVPTLSSVRPNPDVQNHLSTSTPMVYILSSPTGPRALLINNSESFYTFRNAPSHQNTISPQYPWGALPLTGPTVARHRMDREHRHRHRHAQPAAAHPAHVPMHPNNPGAGAVIAQLIPHIWLIVRLMVFVWFFTGGDTSWMRFLMVYGLAIFIFLFNTGVVNDLVDQVWGPVRRHLENLIPLAGPNPQAEAQAREGAGTPRNGQAPTGAQRQPDPAETAARLLAERRQTNGSWLLANIRRAEHAVVLFLASLVPGVGERHIAAREAEANVAAVAEAEERQRREAAEAAATAESDGNANHGGSSRQPEEESANIPEHAAPAGQQFGEGDAVPLD